MTLWKPWLRCIMIAACTAAFPKSYTTNFDGTENPLSEGGAWSHTGLDWKYAQKVNGIAYGTQTGSGGYDDSYAHLSGFGPDQAAWAVIQRTAGSGGIHEVEIHLRWSDSAHSAKGYECLISYDGSYAQIVRWNGPFGDFTYIGWAAHPPVPKTGDTLRASITGSLIVVRYNGAELMRATDSTYRTGNPGMGFYIQSDATNSAMAFTSYTAVDSGVTAGEAGPLAVSAPLRLSPNCPNPFHSSTTFYYTLAAPGPVTLKVYDLLGREAAVLVRAARPAGTHPAAFDGSALPGGTYVLRLTAGTRTETRRMLLLK